MRKSALCDGDIYYSPRLEEMGQQELVELVKQLL